MQRFFRSIAAIFVPPFNGLSVLVVLYYAFAHIVYPLNDIKYGNLPDSDDYMYLAQVLDWLNGQNWFDNIQHRLDPPAGTPIPFSRIAQLPIAAGILFFKQLGLKPHGAAMVTALLEPLFLLGFCLSALKRTARHLVPQRWAGASAYIALFAVALLFEFTPGHVDHHGLVIALVIAAISCVLRLIDEPQDFRAALAAGFILALTMTIALECLPWVLLLSAWLGIWSMRHGGKAAKTGALYGLALIVSSAAGLAVTRTPSTFLEMDILSYSIVYVWLTIAIALPFIGVALAAEASVILRWIKGVGLAALGALVFLNFFPTLVTGPYGALDPRLLPLLLDEVEEAKPILQTAHGWIHVINFMGMGFLGLIVSLAFTVQTRAKEREKWVLITLLMISAIGLTLFYQYRFMGMECALAVLPLTAFVYQGWAWIGRSYDGRKKVWAEIGLLLLVGPLPAVIFPSLFDSRSFNTGFLLFPVDSGRTSCNMRELQYVLRDASGLGDKPRVILSPMELGPELLFRTDHRVLAAPFHMDVQGNVDTAGFLMTSSADNALAIAQRRAIDLVIVCRAVTDLYVSEKSAPPKFIEHLFAGTVPAWLDPVVVPGLTNFVIYKVRAAQAHPDANTQQEKKYQGN